LEVDSMLKRQQFRPIQSSLVYDWGVRDKLASFIPISVLIMLCFSHTSRFHSPPALQNASEMPLLLQTQQRGVLVVQTAKVFLPVARWFSVIFSCQFYLPEQPFSFYTHLYT